MKALEQYAPKVQLIKAFEIRNCFNSEYEAKYNSFHELKTFANTQDDIDYLISAKKKVLIPSIWASQDMVSDYNSIHAWRRNKHLKFYKE